MKSYFRPSLVGFGRSVVLPCTPIVIEGIPLVLSEDCDSLKINPDYSYTRKWKSWRVSEPRTGYVFARGASTKREAIELARERMANKGIENVLETINATLERHVEMEFNAL